MLLVLLELFTDFVIFITVLTQLVIPLWRDRPIFPILNQRRTTLKNSLTSINELNDEINIATELQERVTNIINNKDTKHE